MDSFSSSNTANNHHDLEQQQQTVLSAGMNMIDEVDRSVGGRKSEMEAGVVMVTKTTMTEGGDDDGAVVVDMEDYLEMEVETTETETEDDDDDDEEEEDSDDDDDDDDEEEEETEEEKEERRILSDSHQLKQWAAFYAHPERPVSMDGTSRGRCVLQQAFSEEVLEEEDEDDFEQERTRILADALALRQAAKDFLHPEYPLEVHSDASARNYFSQPWASPRETFGQAEARNLAYQQASAFKELATLYKHPELPIQIDPSTKARNYFDRASADQEACQDKDLCESILADAKALKQLATDYRHPEEPLVADSTSFGRCYFTRPSAEETVLQDPLDVVADARALAQSAAQYRHPERMLEVDSASFGRNYYGRPSAEPTEDESVDDEREDILQDVATLAKQAKLYRHPEHALEVDPTSLGRSYYDRPQAEDQDGWEEVQERSRILKEARKLGQTATMFRHPEAPIHSNGLNFARNYFGRPAAHNDQDDSSVLEFARERAQILQEAQQLKSLATNFLHPEKEVQVHPVCFGRNYYGRASADSPEPDDISDEREVVLAEMEELKEAALDFLHPERPVLIEVATSSGRNFFSRASAPDQESYADVQERNRLLADAATLKKAAVQFAHPEEPLSTDGTCSGRCFFSRPSAVPQESTEEAQVRQLALEDAMNLKKLASDYRHPEKSLEVSPFATARGYFSRASAPDQVSGIDRKEVSAILADANALKQLARDFRHPEDTVKTSDPASLGRSYFSRASAAGSSEHIHTTGYANVHSDEHSHHDHGYGHFDMDEEIFDDMRQTMFLPSGGSQREPPKMQSNKLSSDEEGELSRSPSSIMLFTGAIDDVDHPPLPSMG